MTKPERLPLELEVKVLNINKNKAHTILHHCKPLEEYSTFVEIVRRNIERDKEYGFENAIKECIQNGILKEYLQRKSKEVINMLIAEYDYATDIAVQRAEERKIAYTEGKSLGLVEGSHQKALQTAKMMLTMGYPLGDICKIVELSKEEVESLQ